MKTKLKDSPTYMLIARAISVAIFLILATVITIHDTMFYVVLGCNTILFMITLIGINNYEKRIYKEMSDLLKQLQACSSSQTSPHTIDGVVSEKGKNAEVPDCGGRTCSLFKNIENCCEYKVFSDKACERCVFKK